MNGLFEVAAELQAFCDKRGWRSCFIGGIAVQRWGEPRVTRDVDIVLMAGFGKEDAFVDALLARYTGRIENAREFAIRHRVALLKTPEEVGIDVSLGALPFEEQVVERATVFSLGPELQIRTCSAEDLIILKLFASRPQDIRDAESVVLRNKEELDWQYIEDQVAMLAEAKPEASMIERLNRLREL